MNLPTLLIAGIVAVGMLVALIRLPDWRLRIAVGVAALLLIVAGLEGWGIVKTPAELRPAATRRYSEPERAVGPPPGALAPARPNFDAAADEYRRGLERLR